MDDGTVFEHDAAVADFISEGRWRCLGRAPMPATMTACRLLACDRCGAPDDRTEAWRRLDVRPVPTERLYRWAHPHGVDTVRCRGCSPAAWSDHLGRQRPEPTFPGPTGPDPESVRAWDYFTGAAAVRRAYGAAILTAAAEDWVSDMGLWAGVPNAR